MVPQRVSQLRPRYESLDGAVSAFLCAEYDDCLEATFGDFSPAAVALRARSLIRLRRETEALEVLNGCLGQEIGRERAAEFRVLIATAHVVAGDNVDAQPFLAQARESASSCGSSAVQAEAYYISAISNWSLSKFDEMERCIGQVLALPDQPKFIMRTDFQHYVGSLREVRAKSFDLLGARAAVREDFAEQASLILMAFEELDSVELPDRFFAARLLLNYAVLARDLDMPGAREFVIERLESFIFNSYTKVWEFHIRRALGWCNARHGNQIGAFREFRLSADAAPTSPWRIIAILDRALLARELNELHSAQEELEYALRLCKTVDWQSTRDEERTALLVLAQQLAATDVKEARRLLDRYEAIAAPLPFSSFANRDRRLFADVAYATAQVLRAEGDYNEAKRALYDCYEIWTQIGYESRAAVAAADLAELTKQQHFVEVALRGADKSPNSCFTSRLRSIGTAVPA